LGNPAVRDAVAGHQERSMQTVLSDDQVQFKHVVHRFFDTHSTTTAVRALAETETGFDPLVWSQLSETL
jgi:hypothetical protein